jgi:hypothetical protein
LNLYQKQKSIDAMLIKMLFHLTNSFNANSGL